MGGQGLLERKHVAQGSLDLYIDFYFYKKKIGDKTAKTMKIYSGRSGGLGYDSPRSPPRRFNGLCDTCCELGHLSCDCLLQRDRIYSDVPTLSSPSQNNRSGRGGTGYDLPIPPPSYSGRSGGPGYDIP